MNGIGRTLTGLTTASNESKQLNAMIENTSVLAETVSAKVRRLDEARVSLRLGTIFFSLNSSIRLKLIKFRCVIDSVVYRSVNSAFMI